MQLFIDTADIEEVRRAVALGVISGCTTNPKLAAAAEPGSFRARIREILACCPGPLSVEVLSETAAEMVAEAVQYAAWDPRIVVKIPMCLEGLGATHQLERERDIRVNVTCMVSANQAAMALMAGATYVSLFVGRINDLGYDADAVIRETAELIERGGFDARIIAGSMRQVADIQRSFLAGAHIVTTPYRFLPQMVHHPRTVETIAEFKQAWEEARRRGGLS
ncbi:MAG: transaldolase family protein [Gemmatimonadota bacterium]